MVFDDVVLQKGTWTIGIYVKKSLEYQVESDFDQFGSGPSQ